MPSNIDTVADTDKAATPRRFIDRQELQSLLGMSRSEVYRRLDGDPDFPRPLHIGRAVRWVSTEVAAFQERLMNARG